MGGGRYIMPVEGKNTTKEKKIVERIVCSECSEWRKTLLHRNGTYICKDCYSKIGKEDSPELKARKEELKKSFYVKEGDENE